MANVLIAAGGTGGHVYPGLALADELRARGHGVAFIGGDRAEAVIVPESGYELHTMPAKGLPRSEEGTALAASAVRAAFTLARSVAAARRIIRTVRPDVVVGMGGYVSTGPAWAARLCRVPVVLHEQNAKIVLGQRLSMWTARVLALSLPVEERPRRTRTVVTGNPLRGAIAELARCDADQRRRRRERAVARWRLDPGLVTVLVFGGSQGARVLNESLPRIAPAWEARTDIQVLHIAGTQHETDVRGAWAATRVPHAVEAYVTAMEDALVCADVVVSRSGATTVAELTAVGVASVLVPYVPGGYQDPNARALERGGAALVVDEGEDFDDRLRLAIESLTDDADRRITMARSSRELGVPDAAERLADVVESAAR